GASVLTMFQPAGASAEDWKKVAENRTGSRVASGFVWASDRNRAFLVGGRTAEGTACVMEFDPAADSWRTVANESPAVPRGENFNISGRVAYAPAAAAIFVLTWDTDL